MDIYRLSIGCGAWVYGKANGLNVVSRPARDQSFRAGQSTPLNRIPKGRKWIKVPAFKSISIPKKPGSRTKGDD